MHYFIADVIKRGDLLKSFKQSKQYAFFHVQILKGAKSISSRANCVYELFL